MTLMVVRVKTTKATIPMVKDSSTNHFMMREKTSANLNHTTNG
jgi:hypothetical protein